MTRSLCHFVPLRTVAWMLLALPLMAFRAESPLGDPAQEKRARDLFHEIRCVVCEGQALAESNADLAEDMRHLIRQRIAAGESDQSIRDFLASRYGEGVLMTPPRDARTALLWYLPFLLVIAGLAYVFVQGEPVGKLKKAKQRKKR